MSRNSAVTLIGAGFVTTGVLMLVSGTRPWNSPGVWAGMLFFAGGALVGAVQGIQERRPPRPEVTPTRVTLRFNRAQMGVHGLAGAAWAASGVLSLSDGEFPAWLAWVGIAFGGLVALVALPHALNGRATVEVDGEGIADYRCLTRKVPWEAIAAVRSSHSHGVPSLALLLVSPGDYARHRTVLVRLFGRSIDPLHVVATQLNGTPGGILNAVSRFAPPHLQPQSTAWADDEEVGEDGKDQA
jgi:hypothetical protein